jgi:hypothetical protein
MRAPNVLNAVETQIRNRIDADSIFGKCPFKLGYLLGWDQFTKKIIIYY